jgi:geranylgeranyl pyrophosphate synthase
VLSRAAGARGMIRGQELDLQFETQPADGQQLRTVHRNKTGMLINAAAQLGAIAANASQTQREVLEQYAFSIGLVFQIIDDILDVTSSAEELGKPIGSDVLNEKTTFVSLYGVGASKKMAEELTQQACNALGETFGVRAAFLQQFANSLLKRKN